MENDVACEDWQRCVGSPGTSVGKQAATQRSGSKQQLSPKPHSLHPKRTGNKQQLRKLQPESARQALRAAAADF